MVDPVTAADGHTYQRENIEKWMKGHDFSPVTQMLFEHNELAFNQNVMNLLIDYTYGHGPVPGLPEPAPGENPFDIPLEEALKKAEEQKATLEEALKRAEEQEAEMRATGEKKRQTMNANFSAVEQQNKELKRTLHALRAERDSIQLPSALQQDRVARMQRNEAADRKEEEDRLVAEKVAAREAADLAAAQLIAEEELQASKETRAKATKAAAKAAAKERAAHMQAEAEAAKQLALEDENAKKTKAQAEAARRKEAEEEQRRLEEAEQQATLDAEASKQAEAKAAAKAAKAAAKAAKQKAAREQVAKQQAVKEKHERKKAQAASRRKEAEEEQRCLEEAEQQAALIAEQEHILKMAAIKKQQEATKRVVHLKQQRIREEAEAEITRRREVMEAKARRKANAESIQVNQPSDDWVGDGDPSDASDAARGAQPPAHVETERHQMLPPPRTAPSNQRLDQPTHSVTTWDVQQVQSLLTDLGLEEYCATFESEEIDGSCLVDLNTRDLVEIGICIFGEQRRLKNAQERLSREEPATFSSGVYRWSAQQVHDHLLHRGMKTSAEACLQQRVDGDVLLSVTWEDIRNQLKVPTMKEKKALEKAIGALKEQAETMAAPQAIPLTASTNTTVGLAGSQDFGLAAQDADQINELTEQFDTVRAQQQRLLAQMKSSEQVNYTDGLCCPLSLEIMKDPVVAADGFTYERAAISAWLKNNNTSPMAREELSHKELIPNQLAKTLIQEYFDANY